MCNRFSQCQAQKYREKGKDKNKSKGTEDAQAAQTAPRPIKLCGEELMYHKHPEYPWSLPCLGIACSRILIIEWMDDHSNIV